MTLKGRYAGEDLGYSAVGQSTIRRVGAARSHGVPSSNMEHAAENSGTDTEFAVVGGGLVGMAVAYGLQRLGRQVTVLDEGDVAFRASRGNFGLVWVQGKGAQLPDYSRWTQISATAWPELADELKQQTQIDVELNQPGGFFIALSDAEIENHSSKLAGLRDELGSDYPFEVLGHNALRKELPAIGPQVVGGIYSPMDGHANPLYLLRALTKAFRNAGGLYVNGGRAGKIEPTAGGFRVEAGGTVVRSEKVVLCAGLGNTELAPMVGLTSPVEPQRGQVIICERIANFLNHPTMTIRQVGEGAVQIGDSKEDAGFNDGTTQATLAAIAQRAVATFPVLDGLRVVRTWAALRIMSPDSCPVYDQSEDYPGAFVVNCHSGVTLAGAHALHLAPWIAGGQAPAPIAALSAGRFDVQPAN
jgi:glycine/D-amino acid oxidase-like deaminating enzyme